MEQNSTCFGQFLCTSSGVFHCTHSNGIRRTVLLTACERDQNEPVPSWSCSQAVSKHVWHKPLLCVQWKTPDDVQRNCPKHVEFHSKNKFEKLLLLVDFIIRIFHDARSPERQINGEISAHNLTYKETNYTHSCRYGPHTEYKINLFSC